MRVSKIFSLGKSQYELDFVDIDVDLDLPLFLDSYYIKNIKTPLGAEAYGDINAFVRYFFGQLKSGLEKEAFDLFSYLGEPNETCLGLSSSNPQGRGVGPIDTAKIFAGIKQSSAIQLDVLEDLEDLRIFVPGIDRDKTSDMTTNIIRGQLIKYTQSQCNLWNIPMQNAPSGFVWNRKKLSWETCYTDMLIVNGKKILLVPKSFVSYAKEYTQQKYVQHFVLNFLQEKHKAERTHLLKIYTRKDGTVREWVTKKSVREDIGQVDKEFLVQFTASNPTVFKDFKQRTKLQLRTVLDNELTSESLNQIIEFLMGKLISIPTGAAYATEYQKTVTGILELLTYPRLSNPSLEQEIHDGRKRIDIVFENSAETGFFFRLPTVHQVPSSFIIVECKNYRDDVANEEVDQLSGRFNVNRGRFGMLQCRKQDDMDRLMARCNDTVRDGRGVIIPLVDEDLINALKSYTKKGPVALEEIITDKFSKIALN